jgi:hypothetical protein
MFKVAHSNPTNKLMLLAKLLILSCFLLANGFSFAQKYRTYETPDECLITIQKNNRGETFNMGLAKKNCVQQYLDAVQYFKLERTLALNSVEGVNAWYDMVLYESQGFHVKIKNNNSAYTITRIKISITDNSTGRQEEFLLRAENPIRPLTMGDLSAPAYIPESQKQAFWTNHEWSIKEVYGVEQGR